MKLAIGLLLLLGACFNEEDSSRVIRQKGGPDPIQCVYSSKEAMTCTDGAGDVWTCSTVDEDCIKVGHK